MKWFNNKKVYFLSASLICGNPLDLNKEIDELNIAGVDSLHFDVMDGHFVPRIGLYPEILKSIKKKTNIPVDVHLMIKEPQKYISIFAEAGADAISVHLESDGDINKTIKMIKDYDIKAGVALNPNSSADKLDSIVNHVDIVMLMAIYPGILGQKMLPDTFDKIKEISKKLENHPDVVIEVDGGVTPNTAPDMIKSGAHLLVCGTGTIYRPHEDTILNKVKELRKIIDASI